MPASIRIARIAGIDIRVHVSWFLIFGLIVLTLTESFPQDYPFWSDEKVLLIAAVSAILFFASIVAHELAHAVVARAFRMEVSSITLFLLGGVANLTKEPVSARAEFFMASAGPFTSLVLGIVGIAVGSLAGAPSLQPVRAVAGYLGPVNVALAIFNLLPGFPLDGGRVLRSVIWGIRKDRAAATRLAGRGGQIVALALATAGAVLIVRLHDGFGAWYFLIAYFLWSAASSSIAQERAASAVGGARVSQLMATDVPSVSSATHIGALVREVVLPHNLRAVPVVDGTQFKGIITIGDLRSVEQEKWTSTPVADVMRAVGTLPSLRSSDPLTRAMEVFGETDSPVIPVVVDDELKGLLYRDALEGYVRMREMLGFDRAR